MSVIPDSLIPQAGRPGRLGRSSGVAVPRIWEWIRHHTGSMLASSIDFAAMVCIVEIVRANAVVGTAVGAIGGAFTSFLLGRTWVFRRADAEPAGQLLRYVLVASTSLGLNALGEHVLVNWAGVGYVRARVGVAVLVSNLWNYPLHKHFVFGRRSRPEPRTGFGAAGR